MKRIRVFAVALALAGAAGCTDTSPTASTAPEVEEATSLEELQARGDEIIMVDLPTLAAMTEKIITDDPGICEDQLRARLFADLKRLKTEVEAGVVPRAKVAQTPCREEWWLLLWYSGNVLPTYRASQDAWTEAERQWPGMDANHTKADAFRHAFWNILLAKRINLWWALAYTTAHESCGPEGLVKAMDLHNNDVGRRIFSLQRSRSESQLSTTVKNYSYRRVSSVREMGTPSLVYLR